MKVHEIRYEKLVADFDFEVSNLLEFLNLEWDPNIREYSKTAISRGKINTPSYAQVVQPLYRDASFRWTKYEKYLSDEIRKVQPWLRQFDYDCN